MDMAGFTGRVFEVAKLILQEGLPAEKKKPMRKKTISAKNSYSRLPIESGNEPGAFLALVHNIFP